MSALQNVTVVTERGQVAIPHELGIEKGQRLLWERVSEQELRVTVMAEEKRATGASSVLGFARRFRPEPRTTQAWMDELRAGES